MGEQNENFITKIIEKAGEQGFSFIVMGIVCWGMYSMIIQNDKRNNDRFKELEENYKDCQDYNRQLTQELLNQKS